MKIILDTNFLIYCAKQKINYAEQIDDMINEGYVLVVPSQILAELKDLKELAKKYSDKVAAELAIKLLKENHVEVYHSVSLKADDAIVEFSKGNIVATVDLELAKRVEKLGKVIVIKGMNRLAFR